MNTEECDLELYKEYLDQFYGDSHFGGIFGIKEQAIKASKIVEDYDPKGFESGFIRFKQMQREEYEPRN